MVRPETCRPQLVMKRETSKLVNGQVGASHRLDCWWTDVKHRDVHSGEASLNSSSVNSLTKAVTTSHKHGGQLGRFPPIHILKGSP